MKGTLSDITVPPSYCQYVAGACDQSFDGVPSADALFLYGSEPASIADALEGAVKKARETGIGSTWRSWRDLPISGQIIFSEVCRAMRFSSTIVADVTTLNFNLMFEIGFAIGLGIPLIPIRDTTYVKDERDFDELDILETLGYVDFTNSDMLLENLAGALPGRPLATIETEPAFEAPLYIVKGSMETEGSLALVGAIKKSRIRFRTYDPVESPRLSLTEARRQVSRSFGIFAHLLSPHRAGARVHNALCALVCGMAMAQGKIVLMLQEERVRQPIDYRDIVQSYTHVRSIVDLVREPLLDVYEATQTRRGPGRPRPVNFLQRVDLGDPAAENEIEGIDDYFVETAQYVEAKQGHSRLIVGRKGSGKTAIFYAIRNPLLGSPSRLVADLRPEGYQFTKLREFVLPRLGTGLQEHTMSAFWHFLLLTELARKIIVSDRQYATRAERRAERYRQVEEVYQYLSPGFNADFSQRLLLEVDRIVDRVGGMSPEEIGPALTEELFTGDVQQLEDVVVNYLVEKDEVWLLLDNLDKSWPTHGSTPEDVLVVRSLLEASRKLQHRIEEGGVRFSCLVFLRSDIYTHLVETTSDTGKDTAIMIEWDDIAMFEELIRSRIEASTEVSGEFSEVWSTLCASHIHVQDTFAYLLERTLMRPRDLLLFLRRCIEVAMNRGHAKVEIEDILQGERSYSEDMLFWTATEIGATHPGWDSVPYAFQGSTPRLTRQEVENYLRSAGIEETELNKGIDLLMRFGFLGVAAPGFDDAVYAHNVRYNMLRLWEPLQRGVGGFVIHPAFREALSSAGVA